MQATIDKKIGVILTLYLPFLEGAEIRCFFIIANHTTVVFHLKKSGILHGETSLKQEKLYLNCFSSLSCCLLSIFLTYNLFFSTQLSKILVSKLASFAANLFSCSWPGNNFVISLCYESANHVQF